MALIKFGMMMTDARGKLGGQVFTKTRSGATVRTKVTPTNPQTQAQQNSRAILGSLSAQWRTLTEPERLGWNAAAQDFTKTNIFGDSYNPSGKNLFVGLNANLLSIDQTRNTVPPVVLEIPSYILERLTISVAGATIAVQSINEFPENNYTVVYQATRPMSAGRFNFSGQYATFFVSSGEDAPSDASVYSNYINKFGVPVLGSKISFKVFVIANETGQKSVESVADVVVNN